MVYGSDAKILQAVDNVIQTRINLSYYFDEVAGKKIKYFEALGIGDPGAATETPARSLKNSKSQIRDQCTEGSKTSCVT